MSEFQLALLVIGVIIVALVFAYNRWQESRHNVQFSQRFDDLGVSYEDVKPDMVVSGSSVENQLRQIVTKDRSVGLAVGESNETRLETSSASDDGVESISEVETPAFHIDYCVQLEFAAPLSRAQLDDVINTELPSPLLSRRLRVETKVTPGGKWSELRADQSFSSVRISLQMVDRSGPISSAEVQALCRFTNLLAHRFGASQIIEPVGDALRRAIELDKFCVEMDVQLGINVVAGMQPMSGDMISKAMTEAGAYLSDSGVFWLCDSRGMRVFQVSNLENQKFDSKTIQGLRTSAITVTINVPCIEPGPMIINDLYQATIRIAEVLGGRITDDIGNPVDERGIASITAQLKQMHDRMTDFGICPGSPLATRLFS